MKEISSISNTGLVLFVDDEKRGATTLGTETDCLNYAYTYQSGECYAFLINNKSTFEKGLSAGNKTNLKNSVLGVANNVFTGRNSSIVGKGLKTSRNASYVNISGRNGYAENYGEQVFSVSREKNRARVVELHYTGTTTDATLTELYIGGQGNQRFVPNPDYATAYQIYKCCTALNATTGEIWTKTTIHALKNIGGTFTSVGSHNIHTIRDSNLDYACSLDPIDATAIDTAYLKVEVEGETGHTAYWNISLQITEVRQEETLASNSAPNPDFLGTPAWLKINQDANNTITIPADATKGGAKIVGNGARNLAARSAYLFWGVNLWKITFDLEKVKNENLVVEVRVNNQDSEIFTTVGTHSYYVNTVGGANYIQFMVNQDTGAGACIINNIKAQVVSY